MFNFFGKSKIENNEQDNKKKSEDIIASISYVIKREGSVIVDVAVEEYDLDSMNGLFNILDVLSQDKCYVETVNIIKNSLMSEQKTDLVELLIQHIGQQMIKRPNNKFISTYEETLNSQPCIKPSDMLK